MAGNAAHLSILYKNPFKTLDFLMGWVHPRPGCQTSPGLWTIFSRKSLTMGCIRWCFFSGQDAGVIRVNPAQVRSQNLRGTGWSRSFGICFLPSGHSWHFLWSLQIVCAVYVNGSYIYIYSIWSIWSTGRPNKLFISKGIFLLRALGSSFFGAQPPLRERSDGWPVEELIRKLLSKYDNDICTPKSSILIGFSITV